MYSPDTRLNISMCACTLLITLLCAHTHTLNYIDVNTYTCIAKCPKHTLPQTHTNSNLRRSTQTKFSRPHTHLQYIHSPTYKHKQQLPTPTSFVFKPTHLFIYSFVHFISSPSSRLPFHLCLNHQLLICFQPGEISSFCYF